MNIEYPIRINKYLSAMGICSRREADRLLEAGLVTVNGQTVEAGYKVSKQDLVTVDGQDVTGSKPEDVILLVNKPVGIVCTAEKREKDNIVDFINYPTRLYPVGRLDKESHGLILMTNNGDLVNKLLRARYYHEKEYVVRVNKPIDASFVEKMSAGVYLEDLDETTRPCKVKKLSNNSFSIVLTQGLNRQIRRMCLACGYRVRDLKRTRIMNLTLDGIKEGEYRLIKPSEQEILYKGIDINED